MFKNVIAVATLAAIMLPANAFADTMITAQGSTALLPLVKQSSQDYQSAHAEVKISVAGGGSFTGINGVASGNADMGDSDVIAPPNLHLIDHRVAVVGFGVIANPSAGVRNLKPAQIRAIFSGRVTNWKQVGGKDQPIVVINRPSSSGTRFVFRQTIMGASKLADTTLVVDSSGEVVSTVASTPGAISYDALGYTRNQPVTVLAIGGIAATPANIRSGKYPIWSYEHIFTKTKNPAVEAFIGFIATDSSALDALGYIRVDSMKVRELNR